MSVILRKNTGISHFSGIAKLSIMALIFSLSLALVDTIWAVYLDSFLHSEVYVGLFSALLVLLAFVSYFIFIPLIERLDKAKIYSASILSFIVCYILFSINTSFLIFVILTIATTLIMTFRITSFGILVRDVSLNNSLSRNEGLVYTFNNIAWVIGPIIAGFFAAQFGEKSIFAFSAGVLIIGFIFFRFSNIKDSSGKKKLDKHVVKNFLDFFKDGKRVLAYIMGGGFPIWWTLIYLFMPLHILRSGLSEIWIGYFLFAVAVPLIILEYPFSKWAGKKGFRKVFQIGYGIVVIISVACFFVDSIYLLLGLLVLGGIGVAMLEPTTEAYFFDILKGKEEYRYYGPYNTALDVGGFVGRLPAALLLIFLPFKFIFLLTALFMFILFLFSFKVRKIVESRRKH